MSNTKHTATPWHISEATYRGERYIYELGADETAEGTCICEVELTANAKHIVHCINTAEAKDKRIAELEEGLTKIAEMKIRKGEAHVTAIIHRKIADKLLANKGASE